MECNDHGNLYPGQSIAKVGDIVLTTSARDASPGSRIEAGLSITTGEQLWVQNRTVLTPGSNNYGLQGPMAEGVYTLYIQEKQTGMVLVLKPDNNFGDQPKQPQCLEHVQLWRSNSIWQTLCTKP